MKILFVSYYGPKDSLIYAANALERAGYEVADYPLFRFAHDQYDKKRNYLRHFHESLLEEDPDVIVWWYIGIPAKNMGFIHKLHEHRYHIFFNWDDPFCWSNLELQLADKVKNFDLAAVTCESSRQRYLDHGTKEYLYLLPGHDPKVHQPPPEKNYVCDVLMCCTNLYESKEMFPDQWTSRAKLVEALDAHPDIVLHLYGPESFAKRFPNSYQGFLAYKDNSEKFGNARINLCTHVTCQGDGYLNERTITIMGSGGLLLVDPVKGLERNIQAGIECLVMESADTDAIVAQIEDILKTPEEQLDLIRFKGHQLALDKFTWDHWAHHLHLCISKHFFSPTDYRQLHGEDIPASATTRDELWEFWHTTGHQLGHVCVKQNVPDNFDFEAYVKLNTDLSATVLNTREKAWNHWETKGKAEGRFCCFTDDDDARVVVHGGDANTGGRGGGGVNNLMFLISENILSAEQWFELQSIFVKIRNRDTTDQGLDALDAFCKQHPDLAVVPEVNNFVRLIRL